MWIVGTVVILIAAYGFVTFNRMVRLANFVEDAWSGIDVLLKRRYDIVPSLVVVFQHYAEHETEVYESVARACSESMNTYAPGEKARAESRLSRQTKALLALSETYPDVNANRDYLRLRTALVEVEDLIQRARKHYNAVVRDFNVKVQTFPNYLIASMLGYHREDFFEMEYVTAGSTPNTDLQRKP